MSTNSNNEEKAFEHFPALPPELKMMMVDKMESKPRCLFGGSSRLSWKEAKSSKNAIHGLRIADDSNGNIFICLYFRGENELRDEGFSLVFKEENGNHMAYESLSEDEEIWKIELDASENVAVPAIAHFKYLLKTYQKTIKSLDITSNNEKIVGMDFEIDSLKNLEKLYIGPSIDIRQFLPKIQRQLEDLSVQGIENCRILEQWEPTYQVQEYLSLPQSNLNYQQFSRISARSVHISIGQLTKQDIVHFLKSWYDGTYTGRIEFCRWTIEDLSYDVAFIFQILDEFEGTTTETGYETIISRNGRGARAQVDIHYNVLSFRTHNYREEMESMCEEDDDEDKLDRVYELLGLVRLRDEDSDEEYEENEEEEGEREEAENEEADSKNHEGHEEQDASSQESRAS